MNVSRPSFDASNPDPRMLSLSSVEKKPAPTGQSSPGSVEVDPVKTDRLIGRPFASSVHITTSAKGAQGARLTAASFQKRDSQELKTRLQTLTRKLQVELLDPFGETGTPQSVEIPASIVAQAGANPTVEVSSKTRSSLEYFDHLRLKTRGNLLDEAVCDGLLTVQQACDLSAKMMSHTSATGSWHDLLHGVLNYSDAALHESGPSLMGLAALGRVLPEHLVSLYEGAGPGLQEDYVSMRQMVVTLWRCRIEDALEPYVLYPCKSELNAAVRELNGEGFLSPNNYKNGKALTRRLDALVSASDVDSAWAMSELVTLAMAELCSQPAEFVQDMVLPMAFFDALAAYNDVSLDDAITAAIRFTRDRSAFKVPPLDLVHQHLNEALARHG